MGNEEWDWDWEMNEMFGLNGTGRMNEACFLTRNENEWYREPISSKITSEEDLPPEVASVSD
ncbi:hypothetical protein OsI_01977 [Oryza sativa Indica Group]|uniref:Uncharacterized protein n=1 Tax=Oryza sativa subsp. indica TaxID=39946 RepID=A2WQ45_ORYSI|nr:hypothetical protein OsI_01977 [Oryza sativa Indica Group]